jgi:Ca-activated chloride channel family protein
VTALTSNDPHKPVTGAGLPEQGRALLSVTLQAEDMHGKVQTLHSPVLTLPALDASACNDMPLDPMVAQRLQELQFGDAAIAVRALLMAGDTQAAQRKLAALEGAVAEHPWLRDKLVRLRELAERDSLMSAKELLFSSRKMSSRLAASEAVPYSVNETQSESMPAYLRRKVSEGKGRGGDKSEPKA